MANSTVRAAAPFSLGQRVRYTGHGWKRGDDDTPWVRVGDVGVVVKVVQPEQGTGVCLDRDDNGEPVFDEGTDGWSLVRFHDDERASAAVHADSVGYYEAVS